jgi:hypothetical protein
MAGTVNCQVHLAPAADQRLCKPHPTGARIGRIGIHGGAAGAFFAEELQGVTVRYCQHFVAKEGSAHVALIENVVLVEAVAGSDGEPLQVEGLITDMSILFESQTSWGTPHIASVLQTMGSLGAP